MILKNTKLTIVLWPSVQGGRLEPAGSPGDQKEFPEDIRENEEVRTFIKHGIVVEVVPPSSYPETPVRTQADPVVAIFDAMNTKEIAIETLPDPELEVESESDLESELDPDPVIAPAARKSGRRRKKKSSDNED